MLVAAARGLRRGLLVAMIVAGLYACGSPGGSHANFEAERAVLKGGAIIHGDHARSYLVFTPPGAREASRPLPLVMVFHGAFSTANSIAAQSRFHRIAMREGFIVVYPNGAGQRWDAPAGTPFAGDDVRFLRELVDEIDGKHARVDRARIFAVGLSNGGAMSLRLACEVPGLVAGIAVVAATMPAAIRDACHPGGGVSVIFIAGTADAVTRYGGGTLTVASFPGYTMLSAETSASYFSQANRCADAPTVKELPRRIADDTTSVSVIDYPDCAMGRVELWRVNGGGHSWPGGPRVYPSFISGTISRQIDASEVIWRFFRSLSQR
jgi:polyhydroxybutyrate depolymerase